MHATYLGFFLKHFMWLRYTFREKYMHSFQMQVFGMTWTLPLCLALHARCEDTSITQSVCPIRLSRLSYWHGSFTIFGVLTSAMHMHSWNFDLNRFTHPGWYKLPVGKINFFVWFAGEKAIRSATASLSDRQGTYWYAPDASRQVSNPCPEKVWLQTIWRWNWFGAWWDCALTCYVLVRHASSNSCPLHMHSASIQREGTFHTGPLCVYLYLWSSGLGFTFIDLSRYEAGMWSKSSLRHTAMSVDVNNSVLVLHTCHPNMQCSFKGYTPIVCARYVWGHMHVWGVNTHAILSQVTPCTKSIPGTPDKCIIRAYNSCIHTLIFWRWGHCLKAATHHALRVTWKCTTTSTVRYVSYFVLSFVYIYIYIYIYTHTHKHTCSLTCNKHLLWSLVQSTCRKMFLSWKTLYSTMWHACTHTPNLLYEPFTSTR